MAVLTLHARTLFGATPADIGLMFSLVGMSYVAGKATGTKEIIQLQPASLMTSFPISLMSCLTSQAGQSAAGWRIGWAAEL